MNSVPLSLDLPMLSTLTFALVVGASPASGWQSLSPGIAYRTLKVAEAPQHGDGLLHVVRIDSAKAKVVVRTASAGQGGNKTAGAWADAHRDVVVINAGMYETDFSTHTGLLRSAGHVNNPRWVKAYKSLLTIRDGRAELTDAVKRPKPSKHTVVQNLRLIAGPGKNVWSKTSKRWSEAALAMDKRGRLLLVFSRTPFSMWRFNEILLGAKLGITHAQHLEGGPEASLSIRSEALNVDLSGSYETSFNENDNNKDQWVLPNVIAVHSR